MVFSVTRINRIFSCSQIFGFVSDPYVNILKFYYVVVGLKHDCFDIDSLEFTELSFTACLIFVKDLCVLKKDVYSLLGEFSRYLLAQP